MSSRAQAVRRLPLRQAIETLRSGEGSSTLRPDVKSLSMRYIQKNSESGPREFLRTIVPRIAYSNPSVQFDIQPLKDPRGAEKSKDPKDKSRNPDWQLGEPRPVQEMVVAFNDGAAQTIVLGDLNASAILSRLMSVAGTGGQAATEVQQGEAQSSSTTAARLAPLPTPLQ